MINKQKNYKPTIYMGIALALLLIIFVADSYVSDIKIFKNQYTYELKSNSNPSHSNNKAERENINAPPQPQPIANHPGSGNRTPDTGNIKHNHLRLENTDVSPYSPAKISRSRTIFRSKTHFTGAGYAGAFRVSRTPIKPYQSGKGVKPAADNQKQGKDKPDYFQAPTVQPAPQSTDKNKEESEKQDNNNYVVIRNENVERKLESHLQSGKRALRLNRYNAALSFFNKLYKDYPDDPRVLMGRGIALQHLGRIRAAKDSYRMLLSNDPDNIQAKIIMYGIIAKTKPGLALRRLKAIRSEHSQNDVLAAQIGLISARMNRYDQALKYLKIAASISPNKPRHYYNLGVVEEHRDESEKAIKYYEKAVDLMATNEKTSKISKEAIYDRLAHLRGS